MALTGLDIYKLLPKTNCKKCGRPTCLAFAMQLAQKLGKPYREGFVKNRYVGRTFIEPTQHIRQLGVKLKHSANRSVVEGKRIVLIDDSVVRGTTSVQRVQQINPPPTIVSVVTWGDSGSGGDSSSAAARLASGVTRIFSTAATCSLAAGGASTSQAPSSRSVLLNTSAPSRRMRASAVIFVPATIACGRACGST